MKPRRGDIIIKLKFHLLEVNDNAHTVFRIIASLWDLTDCSNLSKLGIFIILARYPYYSSVKSKLILLFF